MLIRQNTQFALLHPQVSPEATIRIRHISFSGAQRGTPVNEETILSSLATPSGASKILPTARAANGFTVAAITDPVNPGLNLVAACVCSAKDQFSRKKGHRKLIGRIFQHFCEIHKNAEGNHL